MKTQKKIQIGTISTSLFFCFFVVFWWFPALGEELSESQKEIWKLEEKLWDACKKEGGAPLAAFYHKESIMWVSDAAWPSKTGGSGGYYHEVCGNPIESFKLTLHEINNFGNVSVVQYDAEGVDFGKNPFRLRISNSWMKQDGKWVIIGAMHDSCANLPKCPE